MTNFDTEPTHIYTGRVITVTREPVTLPNGHQVTLEIVHHPGGAAVVAVDTTQRVCLLRQYRHVAGGWLWELPAGKRDNDELPLHTAQRELAEEAGITAAQWDSLGWFHSSPGVFNEVIHLFLAQEFTPTPLAHGHGEVIEIHWLALTEAWQWCQDGRITDAKTLLGIYRAVAQLGDERGDCRVIGKSRR